MAISPISIGTSPATAPAPSAGGSCCGGGGCGADDATTNEATALGASAVDTTSGGTAAGSGAAAGSTTTTYAVDGMTCGHCVSSVTEELSAVPGVTDVQVELVAGGRSTVTVASSSPLDPADVAAAVDEAGYQLAGQA